MYIVIVKSCAINDVMDINNLYIFIDVTVLNTMKLI